MPANRYELDQSEVLQRVMEAGPHVLRRHQFFGWSQGAFQRWLPHDLSVCGSYDRDERGVVFDVFNSVPLPDDVLCSVKDARSALLQRAVLAWRRSPCKAVRLTLDRDTAEENSLMSLGYSELLVHGFHRPGRPHELESFFMFSHRDAPYADLALQALETLLPCLHVVYLRMTATESQMRPDRARASRSPCALPITTRECEVLVWVKDGLSNQQIGEKLGISALTVKNHLQKILRKLGAANRAQAVATAMTLDLFGHLVDQPAP